MIGFSIGATLMVGVTLLLLLLPFRRRPATADFSRQQLNAAIYRDQIAELERDRAEGALSQEDYQQAYDELQRRLLEDSANDAATNAAATPAGRSLPTLLAIALPLGAVLLYLTLGSPASLNPPPPEKQFSSEDIDRMVSDLAAKLEKEPDNLKGWAMLARSYKAMGRLPEAVRAYERAATLVDTDPNLLLDYADALAATAGGFTDQVNRLIAKALKLDPANGQALWMRGTAAFEAGQYAKAVADWEQLLALLEPGSEDANMVESNIEEARQKGGLKASRAGPANAKVGAGETAAAANAFVKGRVELASALADKATAADTVMVIARPADGSRMPVAVVRVKASNLPLDFSLDDTLAMSPDHKLSKFAEVTIEARISKTGQAMPESGDLISATQTVKVGTGNLRLIVDQVRK